MESRMIENAEEVLREKRQSERILHLSLRREKNEVEAIFEIKGKQIPELMKYTNSLIQEPQITKAT